MLPRNEEIVGAIEIVRGYVDRSSQKG